MQLATKRNRLLKGTSELFEVLEDIRHQLETERPFRIVNYADAQRELVERVRKTGIHKRKPRSGEILIY
jgi:hypothetical protein